MEYNKVILFIHYSYRSDGTGHIINLNYIDEIWKILLNNTILSNLYGLLRWAA